MARTPGRNRRDVNYAKVGEIGRRTGVKVPDKGVRDEHGFEPIDDLFSSPEKAAATTNGDNDYTVTEDTMEVVESTMLEPDDVLSTARNSSLRLPPPKASPRKSTNIGGSPRRSVGPESSPFKRPAESTPTTRAASHPAQGSARRLLKFGPPDETPKSVEQTPKTSRATSQLRRPKRTPTLSSSGGRTRKNVLDLPTEDDDVEEAPPQTNGFGSPSPPPPIEDDDMPPPADEDEIMPDEEEQAPEIEEEPQAEAGAEISNVMSPPPKKRRGAPKRESLPAAQTSEPSETKRGRGRKRKVDDEPEATAPKKRKPFAPVPPNRGPNSKINKRPQSKPPVAGARSGSIRPNSRNLYEYRGVTPMNEAEHTTRSGRASYKPLSFWVGEKPVIEHGEVKEIIRAEKVESPERVKAAHRRGGAGKKKARRPFLGTLAEEDEEDKDMEAEDWELETGQLSAQVVQWDSVMNTHLDDEFEELEIAYAPLAMQTRDVHGDDSDYTGPTFKFAKLLSMPFFGAGIVDLTPGGMKRIKNSRRMQMVFFVFSGRVTVELGNDVDAPKQSFGIGKGGMWQVPRGNWYAIHNHSTTVSARLFFAQGCHMPQPKENNEPNA